MLQWLFGKKKEPEPAPEKNKKKKKSQAEQQTEDRWQYQFLVQFLNSPLWRVSILDFVDQNCVVFDNEEVNKFQYTKIHNEFKQLVGTLFDGMMQEVGLDEEKLVYLLQKGFQSKQKKLFNQLLLCDDFLKFKQLMVKRNRALEQEAIRALNGQPRKGTKISKQKDLIHHSIKEQQERKRKILEKQEEELRKALELSRLESQQNKQFEKLEQKADNYQKKKAKQQEQQRLKVEQMKRERQRHAKLQEQKQRARQQQQKIRIQQQRIQRQVEQKKRQQQERKAQKLRTSNSKALGDLPPLKNPVRKQTVQTQHRPVIEEVKQQQKTQQTKQQSKGQTVQQRKKRLLEQRQKIRKKKEQQRKKMLDQQQSHNKKVMNIVLQDQGIHDSVHPAVEHAEQKISKDEIQRRKELMKKIKNRIVDDF